MFDSLQYLLSNPLLTLYCLQAFTYGAAAASEHSSGNKGLTGCYAMSALLHGLLGTCHLMHLG